MKQHILALLIKSFAFGLAFTGSTVIGADEVLDNYRERRLEQKAEVYKAKFHATSKIADSIKNLLDDTIKTLSSIEPEKVYISTFKDYEPITIDDSLNSIHFIFDKKKGQIVITDWTCLDSLSITSYHNKDENDTVTTEIGFKGLNPHNTYKNDFLILKRRHIHIGTKQPLEK